jgi:biopolymer transport protein ExbB/TolQ
MDFELAFLIISLIFAAAILYLSVRSLLAARREADAVVARRTEGERLEADRRREAQNARWNEERTELSRRRAAETLKTRALLAEFEAQLDETDALLAEAETLVAAEGGAA